MRGLIGQQSKPQRRRPLRRQSRPCAMDFATATALSWKRDVEVVMAAVVTPLSTKAMTRWVVVLTGIGSLMAALDTLAVSTALSEIRLDLGASVEQLEWVVNAYNLSFAVLLITGAVLGDRY